MMKRYNNTMSKRFSLITFNTMYNKGLHQFEEVLRQYKPDVVCLQEIDTTDLNLRSLVKNDYYLADYSVSFKKFGKSYGVATYYHAKTISVSSSVRIDITRSMFDAFFFIFQGGNNPRSILKTNIFFKPTSRRINIYNVHLSPWGSNGARLKQLKKTLKSFLSQKKDKTPMIIAGDLNYFPLRRKKLEQLMQQYGFNEATKQIDYTFKPEKFKDNFIHTFLIHLLYRRTGTCKLDYVFTQQLTCSQTKRIETDYSDHSAIITYFKM